MYFVQVNRTDAFKPAHLKTLDKVIHVIHVYAGWYAQIYKTLSASLQ